MYNAMGKILKFTIVHFWYHVWFLHINFTLEKVVFKIKSDTLSFTHFVRQT